MFLDFLGDLVPEVDLDWRQASLRLPGLVLYSFAPLALDRVPVLTISVWKRDDRYLALKPTCQPWDADSHILLWWWSM